jgi:hypothetical protein
MRARLFHKVSTTKPGLGRINLGTPVTKTTPCHMHRPKIKDPRKKKDALIFETLSVKAPSLHSSIPQISFYASQDTK